MWHPSITREEVFFSGKENIEGFVCLLSQMLVSMVRSENPALINVDNHDFDESEELKDGQLYF